MFQRHIFSILVLGLVCGFYTTQSLAQAQWSQQSPQPTARQLFGAAFTSPSHGFIVGVSGTFMETHDAGKTWIQRNYAIFPSEPFYEIYFKDANNGFVVGNSTTYGPNLFRTTDGGATWSQITNFPLGGSWYHIDFVSPNVGFMGSNGAVVRTTNGGASWQLMSGYPTAPVVFGMDFKDSQLGLAVGILAQSSENGVFKTTDGGATWTNRFPTSANDVVFLSTGVAIMVTPSGGIFRSADNGDSWTQIATVPTGLIEFAVISGNTLAGVSWKGDVWRSADGGGTWTQVLKGLGIGLSGESWDITFLDSSHGTVVGPFGMIFGTTDGGLTWNQVSNGVGNHLYGVDMITDTFGFVVGEGGYMLRTTDGGRRWDLSRLLVTGTVFGRTETLEAISMNGQNFGVTAGWGGIVFKTNDGGQNWTSIGYPALPGAFRIYDVKFPDPNNGWVVGADDDPGHTKTIWRTRNGGASWTLQPLNLAISLYAVDFVNAVRGWVVGPRGVMWRTENGGETWIRVSLPGGGITNLTMNDVDFIDPYVGWIVGNFGWVLRSTDGGRNWTRQDLGSTDSLADIEVISQSEAWAVSVNGNVFHTTNGGLKWTKIPTPYNLGLYGIGATSTGNVWVAGFDGAVLTNVVQQTVLSGISFNPASVAGGLQSQGTVTLTGPAPPGGAVISLLSSDPSTVTVPATVTIPAGATSAAFTATTYSVSVSVSPTITASYFGSSDVSARLNVLTMLAGISVSPPNIRGGRTGTGTVTLNGPAPAGGAVVSLWSGFNTVASFPKEVTVPAGATSVTFVINTVPVTTTTAVVLGATYDGVSRNTLFQVLPPG